MAGFHTNLTDRPNTGGDRGFTGHEHLDDIGLVHMNGRIFDPTIAKFLQADPHMTDPMNLQNYNRYAYCYNNPLTCTDPTGLDIFSDVRDSILHPDQMLNHIADVINNDPALRSVAIAVISYYTGGTLSGYLGVTNVMGQAAISGFISGAISTGNLEGALQGSFQAAMFAGAGNLIQGGDFFAGGVDPSKALSYGQGVALHGVVGCVTSAASGGNCGSGALSAALSEAALPIKTGVIQGTIVSAVIGGTASVIGGGTFENGARTAAFGYLFNCLQHDSCSRETRKSFEQAMTAARDGIKMVYDLWSTGFLISTGAIVEAGAIATAVELGPKIFVAANGMGQVGGRAVLAGKTLTFENFSVGTANGLIGAGEAGMGAAELAGPMSRLVEFAQQNGATQIRLNGYYASTEGAALGGGSLGQTFSFTLEATRAGLRNLIQSISR